MNSFIFITNNQDKKTAYINDFAKEHGIGKFDIHFFEPLENSFGINDVRNLQKTAYIKPMQSKEKILIVEKAESLTTEAQNALLKLLEEPPSNTYIMLSALTDAQFLPTIVSRCKVIILGDRQKELSLEEKEILQKQLKKIEKGTIGEKLTLAETLSQEKETLSAWFDNSILLLREQMIENPKDQVILLLMQHVQEARSLFQTTNVSPRMILEHCFLSL